MIGAYAASGGGLQHLGNEKSLLKGQGGFSQRSGTSKRLVQFISRSVNGCSSPVKRRDTLSCLETVQQLMSLHPTSSIGRQVMWSQASNIRVVYPTVTKHVPAQLLLLTATWLVDCVTNCIIEYVTVTDQQNYLFMMICRLNGGASGKWIPHWRIWKVYWRLIQAAGGDYSSFMSRTAKEKRDRRVKELESRLRIYI